MTSVCPKGHTSDAADYCDVCGSRIGGPPPAAPSPPPPSPAPPAPGAPAPAAPASAAPVSGANLTPEVTEACPACGAHNAAGTRFCEDCGTNLSTLVRPSVGSAGEPMPAGAAPAPPPSGARWEAVAVADRGYFERIESEGIVFPVVYEDRRFPLTGEHMAIGRRSVSKGVAPEIDLSAAPEDIGVSHRHAVLVADAEGGWSVIDPGSTNGTYLNDDTDALAVDEPVRLHDGDRLHVGAWTTITLHQLG